MHDLQLVGFTTDRRGLIFRTADGSRAEASFVVPVTPQLVALVGELGDELVAGSDPVETAAETAAGPAAPDAGAVRPRSRMSVRDIQARLRAGEARSRIAAEAGVDEDWIERFAPPIRAEQQRIVERALDRHLERSRSAPSAVPLRRAVGMALADKGVAFTVAAYEAAWSARLLGHDRWAVEFTYRHRGRERTATWIYDTAADALTTADRSAAQLGYVAPGRVPEGAGDAVDGIVGDPNAPAQRLVPPAESAPTASPAARSGRPHPQPDDRSPAGETTAPAKKAVTRKRSSGKKAAAKRPSPATKAGPGKASSASGAAKKKPAPAKRATGKKAAAKKETAPAKRATGKKAAAKKETAPAKRATGKKAAAKKKAPADKSAAKKRVAKETAAEKRAAKKTAVTRKAAAEEASPAGRSVAEKASGGEQPAAASASDRRAPVEDAAANASAVTAEAATPRPEQATVAPETAPTATTDRLPDDVTRSVPDRPRGEPTAAPAPAPSPPRPVAGRPGDVPLAEAPLAGRGPAANGHGPAPATDAGRAAGGDADPSSARRARAAERNTPTVHFRSGSAAPVRAAGEAGRSGADERPAGDRGARPRAEDAGPDGAARPASRRRRQLRAR